MGCNFDQRSGFQEERLSFSVLFPQYVYSSVKVSHRVKKTSVPYKYLYSFSIRVNGNWGVLSWGEGLDQINNEGKTAILPTCHFPHQISSPTMASCWLPFIFHFVSLDGFLEVFLLMLSESHKVV